MISALAREANALPTVTGVTGCPADNGSKVLLRAAYPNHHSATVSVALTGCQTATNGHLTRTAIRGTGPLLLRHLKSLTSPEGTNLAEIRVGRPPEQLALGAGFRISDTTRNIGSRPTARSITGFYLEGPDGVIRLGERVVGALRPGARSIGHTFVHAPSTPPGAGYFLVACADDRHRIRETDELDDCKVAASGIQVGTPNPGQPPQP